MQKHFMNNHLCLLAAVTRVPMLTVYARLHHWNLIAGPVSAARLIVLPKVTLPVRTWYFGCAVSGRNSGFFSFRRIYR